MKKITRRILTIIPAVAVQGLWIYLLLKWLHPYTALITTILSIFSFFFVLYVITLRDESTYKILWLLVILTFPLPGALLYLIFGNKRTARPLELGLARADMSCVPTAMAVSGLCEETVPMEGSARMEQTVRWLEKKTGCPLHRVESVKYYSLGDEMYPDMLRDLKAAERFIYIEYFIIAPGLMWDSIAEILEQKVKEGVDVRVMYDDLGSIATFNIENRRQLWEKGVKCVTFNPLVAVKGTCNYRDHRKMLIIDGAVAYSGGVNLADEYINRIEKYGHWKDVGFRLTGAPVRNYVRMFLQFWNAFSGQPVLQEPILPDAPEPSPQAADGFVLSYYDSPLSKDATTNQLYADLLSQATEYVWFFTPYLMLGDKLLDAIISAARRGVDVRILMPGIPDKKQIFRMSRSYYQVLLMEGVKIYEYTPGFLHAKGVVIDGRVCACGTVNLDYRSLFLHFENNSLFFDSSIVDAMKDDFLATQEKSRQIQPYDMNSHFLRRWIVDGVLRIFAPLC